MRVRAHAAIWADGMLVVHSEHRRGNAHFTLPGGRVNERESVTDALRREAFEELGIEVEVGDLVFCGEVVSAASHHEIELVFEATLVEPLDHRIETVDPGDPHVDVLPPVLHQLACLRDGIEPGVWVGNLYDGRIKEH